MVVPAAPVVVAAPGVAETVVAAAVVPEAVLVVPLVVTAAVVWAAAVVASEAAVVGVAVASSPPQAVRSKGKSRPNRARAKKFFLVKAVREKDDSSFKFFIIRTLLVVKQHPSPSKGQNEKENRLSQPDSLSILAPLYYTVKPGKYS